jgi:hypothetical protein
MGWCIRLRISSARAASLARFFLAMVVRSTQYFPLRVLLQACVNPRKLNVSGFCESRGPESYWIPAYAGKTLKNAVPSCADRPAGFLCDPSPRLPCESRGPEAYWIPAYAGKTLKNAVPSCADRPAGFLCDPCLRHPCESRGPDPVRLHNNARGIRRQACRIPV